VIRTADLTGAQLDYHTARAQGIPAERLKIRRVPRTDTLICVDLAHPVGFTSSRVERLDYSDDWNLAGALLEQHNIELEVNTDTKRWQALYWRGRSMYSYGPTPQVAICRAVVRAAFGDEVEEVAVCE